MSIVNIPTLKQLGCELWFNGSNAAANAPKAITAAGDVKQILPFGGAGIGMFDGTGDYLQTSQSSDLTISGDFTIEALVYLRTVHPTNLYCRYIAYSVGGNVIYLGVRTHSGAGWIFANIQGNTPLDSGVVSLNAWHHIVFQRSGTALTVFLDGVSVNTATYSTASTSNYFNIGCNDAGVEAWDGYMSELRISDVARYTANFTPPRKQLQNDANTKLLLHFNRNDTTFIDSSPSPKTVTAYGDAKQLCSPCGSGIAVFDGTGDYLSTPYHADVAFGSEDFTIAFYVKGKALSINQTLFARYNRDVSDTISYAGYINPSNNIVFLASSDGNTAAFTLNSTSTVSDIWMHVAITRHGNTWTLWINGNAEATTTSSITIASNSSVAFTVGALKEESTWRYLTGYISDFLVVKGIAKYTETFTPPTAPTLPDPYTKLLLHMDGVGAAFYDASDRPGDNGFPILPDGVTVTPAGTFAVQKLKNGQNCLKFDGSTNYISLADNDAWNLGSGDFTICFWLNLGNVSALRQILSQYYTSKEVGFYVAINSSSGLNFGWKQGGSWVVDLSLSGDITSYPANTWIFCSITRYQNYIEIRKNNQYKTSVTYTGTFSNNTAGLSVGFNGSGSTYYLNGNIKDLMIFKGKALSVDQIGAIMAETFIY